MLLVDHDEPVARRTRRPPTAAHACRSARRSIDSRAAPGSDCRAAFRRRLTGEQLDAQRLLHAHPRPAPPRLRVLLGEQLGRRHQALFGRRARREPRLRARPRSYPSRHLLAAGGSSARPSRNRRRARRSCGVARRSAWSSSAASTIRSPPRCDTRHGGIGAALAALERDRDAEREQLAEDEPALPRAIAAVERRELVARDRRRRIMQPRERLGECRRKKLAACSMLAGTPSSARSPTRAPAARRTTCAACSRARRRHRNSAPRSTSGRGLASRSSSSCASIGTWIARMSGFASSRRPPRVRTTPDSVTCEPAGIRFTDPGPHVEPPHERARVVVQIDVAEPHFGPSPAAREDHPRRRDARDERDPRAVGQADELRERHRIADVVSSAAAAPE